MNKAKRADGVAQEAVKMPVPSTERKYHFCHDGKGKARIEPFEEQKRLISSKSLFKLYFDNLSCFKSLLMVFLPILRDDLKET